MTTTNDTVAARAYGLTQQQRLEYRKHYITAKLGKGILDEQKVAASQAYLAGMSPEDLAVYKFSYHTQYEKDSEFDTHQAYHDLKEEFTEALIAKGQYDIPETMMESAKAEIREAQKLSTMLLTGTEVFSDSEKELLRTKRDFIRGSSLLDFVEDLEEELCVYWNANRSHGAPYRNTNGNWIQYNDLEDEMKEAGIAEGKAAVRDAINAIPYNDRKLEMMALHHELFAFPNEELDPEIVSAKEKVESPFLKDRLDPEANLHLARDETRTFLDRLRQRAAEMEREGGMVVGG